MPTLFLVESVFKLRIIDRIHNKIFFLDTPGTAKTFVINLLLAWLKSKNLGKIIMVIAATSIITA